MKIALCSTSVPFVDGGYKNIVEWLKSALQEHGHQVEVVYIPSIEEPDLLFQQMMALRWIDLDAADRIICFRPQSHLIPHPNKVLWFIHHIRLFYDLWDSQYRNFPDDTHHRGIRKALHNADTNALAEANAVFTNSRVMSERLATFNNVASEVLYPPVTNPDRFHNSGFNDEIVYVSRLEHHKRQHLLVEALKYTKSPVRLRLLGAGSGSQYPKELQQKALELGIADRVTMDNSWVTEEEKVEQLAHCLAAAYIPFDEDSYGYPSVEASHAAKPILTTTDSGGVLELVEDGTNGYVSEPDPQALAEAMDRLYFDRSTTQQMGREAQHRLAELNISWTHVVDRLLA
jgi:glycosyltransferase involved in cell wall biosynthesis